MLQFPVAMAKGSHLFPYRTQKVSPSAPMVLGWTRPGRVGRRRIPIEAVHLERLLFCYGTSSEPLRSLPSGAAVRPSRKTVHRTVFRALRPPSRGRLLDASFIHDIINTNRRGRFFSSFTIGVFACENRCITLNGTITFNALCLSVYHGDCIVYAMEIQADNVHFASACTTGIASSRCWR